MPYTQADFDRDLAKLRELSAGEKPLDLCQYMQWEMAWTHRATAIYFSQVYKLFPTSAPTEDAENFLGYAQQWVRFLEFHFKIEDEVIFPILSKLIPLDKSHAAHAQIAGPLAALSSYLSAVASGATAWSAEKAEEHAQALLPVLMAHFVEQLQELDPEALRKGGATTDALEGLNKGVAAKAGELVDPTREVPSMVLHNDGRLDWPAVPWPMTAEFKMPPELYKAHSGWWKYSQQPLPL